jgi:uncharacterized damage-inducible protein DinB
VDRDELADQLIAAWRRHNEILLFLLENIPSAGLSAVPLASRGRTVAAQFAHLDRVRRGWLHYHSTGERPRGERADKDRLPTKAQLARALAVSGRDVEAFLGRAIREDVRPRMFGRQVVRWIGYLISHESHHRGQIVLALKQNGLRLPERVGLQGLWGKWIFGK